MKPFGFTAVQMTQSSHRRSPSFPHASKPKTSRPALHRKGASSANISISKLGRGHTGHSRAPSKEEDPEFDMSAGFLNFCAMCENQITVPNNSLLYCSEGCRRKDSRKPLSASLPSVTNMSTMAPAITTSPPTPNSPPLSPRTIVAPMTPTRPIPAIRIPTDSHDAKSDLDPTEWKPLIPSRRSGGATSLASSDAWSYLSQFHGATDLPTTHRSSRSSASLPTLADADASIRIPSLTHTPSTIASSFSSTASDDLVSMYESSAQRPLGARHRPSLFSAPKSVDLVVPHVASVPDVEPAFQEEVWEDVRKKSTPISMARTAGSVGGVKV